MKQKPPILVMLYYAGHGVQHGNKVYLVPGEADVNVDHLEDLDTECVSLDEILQTLQKYWEEEIKKEHGRKQSLVFLIVPDSCRKSIGERSVVDLEAAKFENAPSNYTIIYSCSRSTAASDGPQGGHSPFASAFLDKERGFFAEGISLTSAIAHVNSVLQKSRQKLHRHLTGEGLEDFCIRPKPIIQPNEVVASLGTSGAIGARCDVLSHFCNACSEFIDLFHIMICSELFEGPCPHFSDDVTSRDVCLITVFDAWSNMMLIRCIQFIAIPSFRSTDMTQIVT